MTDKELAKEYVDKLYAEKVSKEDYDKYGWILYGSEDISDAFLAGLKTGKDTNVSTKWRKVADGDLPKNSDNEKLYLVYWGDNDYGVAQFNNSRWWSLDSGWYDAEDVIAWCEIPQYTEE